MKPWTLVTFAIALTTAVAPTRAWGQKSMIAPPAQAAEQQVMQLENEWTNAYLHGDAKALERIEAAGYVDTGIDGSVTGKAQDIADTKSGAYKLESATPEDMKVHLFGDVAVVTTRWIQKATYKGEDRNGTYAGTDVFVRRGGRWEVVASQYTKLK